jgi:hypothetical protein
MEQAPMLRQARESEPYVDARCNDEYVRFKRASLRCMMCLGTVCLTRSYNCVVRT